MRFLEAFRQNPAQASEKEPRETPFHLSFIAEQDAALLDADELPTSLLTLYHRARSSDILPASTISFVLPTGNREKELMVINRLSHSGLVFEQPREDVPSLYRGNHMHDDGILVIRFGADGRNEVTRAIRRALADGRSEAQLTEKTLGKYLDIPELPPIDMQVYLGEEDEHMIHLQNADIWQAVYAEFTTSEKSLLSFGEVDVDKAIAESKRRVRRFGGLPGR